MENTSDRLQELMQMYNIKQVDIVNKCKPIAEKYGVKPFGKPRVSEWVKGRCKPGQWHLSIIGEAFNVSEAWLIGLDVPMERKSAAKNAAEDIDLLASFSELTDQNKKIVLALIDTLKQNQ